MTTAALSERLAPVQQYARLLLQLDDLMLQGNGDSPEADALRDQMEEPWYAMTEHERERVGGLSEDLYALAAGGPKSAAMSPVQRSEWAKSAKAVLKDSDDPDAALAFLRRPHPDDLSVDAIPFLQARRWERLGDLEVALRFMREAERRNPKRAIVVLVLLVKCGRWEEAETYASRILTSATSTPEEIILAATSRLLRPERISDKVAKSILDAVVPDLSRAWKDFGTEDATERKLVGADA